MTNTKAPALTPEQQEWIDALRSGTYQQGRDRMASVDADGVTRYCCLGVACDLAVKAGEPIEVTHDSDGAIAFDGASATDVLPTRVARRLNMWLGGGRELALLNDRGVSFAQIADYIEACAAEIFEVA